MPLKPPSFFDELPRMRQPSRRFNPNTNFALILKQLTDACRVFPYLAISPQNLRNPAQLLSAIVLKDGKKFRTLIDPKIVRTHGKRARWEACSNIFLFRSGKPFCPAVLVERPTWLLVEARDENGVRQLHRFQDAAPYRSTKNGLVGAVCHEVDHLHGRLIVDHARDLLIKCFDEAMAASKERKEEIASLLPFVLMCDGDGYVLRHGLELAGNTVPDVSPDVMFLGAHFGVYKDIDRFRVPRAQEMLPIRHSELLKDLYR